MNLRESVRTKDLGHTPSHDDNLEDLGRQVQKMMRSWKLSEALRTSELNICDVQDFLLLFSFVGVSSLCIMAPWRMPSSVSRIERALALSKVATIITDLIDARSRLTDVEARIAGLQERIDATNTLALRVEGRSVSALQSVEDLQNLIEE
ncbi:hypothetical protein LXL04_033049 [Taraxacum kok-saghyz]